MRTPAFIVASLLAITTAAFGQQAGSAASSVGYPSVAAALDGMRAKPGVRVTTEGGWTIIEDSATQSLWSFTPPQHAAHPAVVRRTIVTRGDNLFVQTDSLCEASKPACDRLLAEFEQSNRAIRGQLPK